MQALNIVVNFTIDGPNPYGVEQKPCIDCGNCVTGCNVGAKNTLYMNFLPMAAKAGATILTQTKVEWLEKLAAGGWRIHGKHVNDDLSGQSFTLDARRSGSVGRRAEYAPRFCCARRCTGLAVSPALGTKFSGNGDFFGLAYNCDYETDVLGYPRPQGPKPGDSPEPGPNIVGLVRYNGESARDAAHRGGGFFFPQRLHRRRARPSSERFAGRIRLPATKTRNAQRLLARPGSDRARARPQRRAEPYHAVPGDGPGQRARHHSVRRAVDGAGRPHPSLVGSGWPAADFHAHE